MVPCCGQHHHSGAFLPVPCSLSFVLAPSPGVPMHRPAILRPAARPTGARVGRRALTIIAAGSAGIAAAALVLVAGPAGAEAGSEATVSSAAMAQAQDVRSQFGLADSPEQVRAAILDPAADTSYLGTPSRWPRSQRCSGARR